MIYDKKILIISLFALFALLYFIYSINLINLEYSYDISNHYRINKSISAAGNFIYNSYKNDGSFRTYICKTKFMLFCRVVHSPFTISSIVYSIKDSDFNKSDIILKSSLKHVEESGKDPGIWNFWGNPDFILEPSDLDDTALSSFVLSNLGGKNYSNYFVFEDNRNEDGLYYTWVDVSSLENDIDCVVNANVLLYIGEDDEVCFYINDAIKNNLPCSIYYLEDVHFYYSVSRALVNGVSCLNDSRDIVIKNVLSNQRRSGSFGNSLDTALSLNTLMDFGYFGPELDRGISSLINIQNSDGSWNIEPYFYGRGFYFGSSELTTAISIEALSKYFYYIKN